MIKDKIDLQFSSKVRKNMLFTSADLLKTASQLDKENEYTLMDMDAQIIIFQ